MAEYIDRAEVLNRLHEVGGCGADPGTWADGYDKAIALAYDIVEGIPAADVTPVRRGRWLRAVDTDCEMHKCNRCGARVVKGLFECENPNLFCYRCGAYMGGADNDK